MKGRAITRRLFTAGAMSMLLGACAIVPKGSRDAPPPTPEPTGVTTALPGDTGRHQVALLVPQGGSNGAVGQAIANASTMALLDTNATNLRITTYDTSKGPQQAARSAVADGNRLILGPLLAAEMAVVQGEARKAGVTVVAFSNDTAAVGPGTFVIGHIPEQSIARTVAYARGRGLTRFAILSPGGEYGTRAEAALKAAVAANGATFAGSERFDRGNTSIISAAQRLRARGGFDAVLIAEGARLAEQGANILNPKGTGSIRILGTDLWTGESSVTRAASLRGAWFSAVSDDKYKRFTDSYEARFGSQPHRIATLGYDAVLMTLKVARGWKPGKPFPVTALRAPNAFLGLDGAFRFQANGVVERALEVREVRAGSVAVLDKAPAGF